MLPLLASPTDGKAFDVDVDVERVAFVFRFCLSERRQRTAQEAKPKSLMQTHKLTVK